MKTAELERDSMLHNKELSIIFKKMSDCYKYLGRDQRFRAGAYETASKTIANLADPIDKYNHLLSELDSLKGVGKSIAEKIMEYLDTGKINAFEELKKKIPVELLDLMQMEGIGSATIRLLHDLLNINSRNELIDKITKGKLSNIKGIKERKIDLIIHALNLNNEIRSRIPFKDAFEIGSKLLNQVSNIEGVKYASLAGSIRREKETIGDIDIVIAAPKIFHKEIISSFVHLKNIKRILIKGNTKASVILSDNNIQCDIRLVEIDEYGAALLYFTGSKEHNIMLRSLAKKRGLKINEYGVFKVTSGKKIAGKTEESIYKILGLPCISPKMRTCNALQ